MLEWVERSVRRKKMNKHRKAKTKFIGASAEVHDRNSMGFEWAASRYDIKRKQVARQTMYCVWKIGYVFPSIDKDLGNFPTLEAAKLAAEMDNSL